ncbi:MAG: hypothetical protein A2096_17650 [Spirochaetes bacterium GWF1_41_5]|nr:MAG: hypothetical protein A2096_17650 [Spirochaetes bacterium GWF1_41_5]
MTGEELFVYQFNLTKNDWEEKRIALEDLKKSSENKTSQNIDISKLSYVYLQSTKKFKMSIGPVKLEPETGAQITLAPVPQVLAMQTEKPINIDGKINEKEWKSAPEYKLEYQIKDCGQPKEATVFKLLYDHSSLYLAAELASSDTAKLRKEKTKDGGNIYEDDCLEFFLSSKNDLEIYIHFIVNSLGVKTVHNRSYDKVADRIETDTAYKIPWQAACHLEPQKWQIEISIPLAELGLIPPLNKIAGFQIGRENHVLPEYSSFVPTDKFPNAKNFGVLIFAGTRDNIWQAENVNLQKISDRKFTLTGNVLCKNQAIGSGQTLDILGGVVNSERNKISGQTVLKSFSFPAQQFSLNLDYPAESEGQHRLFVKIESSSKDACWQAYNFQHTLPLKVIYGEITVNPQPKKIKWGKDFLTLSAVENIIYIIKSASSRTEKTAIFLAEELYDYWGRKFKVEKIDSAAGKKGIFLLAGADIPPEFSTGDFAKEAVKIPPEGYYLTVNDNGVLLKGSDEPGLYYAVVTLMQVIKGPMKITEQPQVKKTEILDWPDLKYRYYGEHTMWHRKKKERDTVIEEYKKYIKMRIAGQKFNILSMQLDHKVFSERHPKVENGNGFITKKDLQEIEKLCREHFIEFIPGVASAGHFNWVPASVYPDLFEPGFSRAANFLNPGFYEFIFSYQAEIMEGLNCKFFNITHDEIWSLPPKEAVSELNGIPRKEILYKDILKQYEFFKARGVRMLMYGDMLLKTHNGDEEGPRKGIYEITSRLPKDIIIVNWSSGHDPDSGKTFSDQGFEVINANNGFIPSPGVRESLAGFGMLCYGTSHLMSGAGDDIKSLQYGYSSVLRSADYAWNIKSDSGTSVREFERNKMINLCSVNAVKANPRAKAICETVDLSRIANAELKKITDYNLAISAGQQDIGFVPMLLPQTAGNNVIALAAGSKPILDLGKKASALYFLQAFHVDAKLRPNLCKRYGEYIWGIITVNFTITYSDGTTSEAKLRFGLNTLDLCPPDSRCIYMPDVRYIYQAKTETGAAAFLYQWEWVNPYPEKEIQKIVMIPADTEAIPVVYALSLRGVK